MYKHFLKHQNKNCYVVKTLKKNKVNKTHRFLYNLIMFYLSWADSKKTFFLNTGNQQTSINWLVKLCSFLWKCFLTILIKWLRKNTTNKMNGCDMIYHSKSTYYTVYEIDFSIVNTKIK